MPFVCLCFCVLLCASAGLRQNKLIHGNLAHSPHSPHSQPASGVPQLRLSTVDSCLTTTACSAQAKSEAVRELQRLETKLTEDKECLLRVLESALSENNIWHKLQASARDPRAIMRSIMAGEKVAESIATHKS